MAQHFFPFTIDKFPLGMLSDIFTAKNSKEQEKAKILGGKVLSCGS